MLDASLPEDVTPRMRTTFCNVSLLKAAGAGHSQVVQVLLAAGAAISATVDRQVLAAWIG